MGVDQNLLLSILCNGMNLHLPAILGFTRCQGFDQYPYEISWWLKLWYYGSNKLTKPLGDSDDVGKNPPFLAEVSMVKWS